MALTDHDLSMMDAMVNQLLSIDGMQKIHKVILYGSRTMGTAQIDSDYDILIVEEDPVAKHDETLHLRREMRSFGPELDIWVMGRQEFEETKGIIGGLAYPANKYGQVLYENA